jgi:hypothetical protein
MKLYSLIALLCYSTLSFAQHEKLIGWDEKHGIQVYDHVVDKDGSIYILSLLTGFYPGPGTLCGGTGQYGLIVTKQTADNEIAWQKLYELSLTTWGGRPYIFLTSDGIFLPYQFNGDYQACDSKPPMLTSLFTTQVAYLLLDKKDGAVLRESVFPVDVKCNRHDLKNVVKLKDSSFSLIYSVEDTLFIRNLLPNGVSTMLRKIDSTHRYKSNIFYDSYHDSYLMGDLNSLYVYDRNLTLLKSFPLPPHDSNFYFTYYNIASNNHYYAIYYYGGQDNNHKSRLIIIDKTGRLVSAKEYQELLADVLITKSNKIWALESKAYVPVPFINKPVHYYQMDIRQNILNTDSIGYPAVSADKISVVDNTIYITGTSLTGHEGNEPRTPDEAYIYKKTMK